MPTEIDGRMDGFSAANVYKAHLHQLNSQGVSRRGSFARHYFTRLEQPQ